MADIHPAPVPDMMGASLPGTGPEFPHAQANMNGAGSPLYDVPPLEFNQEGLRQVLAPAQGGPLQESGYAHDVNAGAVAPYYPGAVSPIYVNAVNSPAANDDVAGTVSAAVTAAEARFMDYQQDIEPQGSSYGTLIDLPPSPLDPGVGSTGTTDPSGAFYDPPRNY